MKIVGRETAAGKAGIYPDWSGRSMTDTGPPLSRRARTRRSRGVRSPGVEAPSCGRNRSARPVLSSIAPGQVGLAIDKRGPGSSPPLKQPQMRQSSAMPPLDVGTVA